MPHEGWQPYVQPCRQDREHQGVYMPVNMHRKIHLLRTYYVSGMGKKNIQETQALS